MNLTIGPTGVPLPPGVYPPGYQPPQSPLPMILLIGGLGIAALLLLKPRGNPGRRRKRRRHRRGRR